MTTRLAEETQQAYEAFQADLHKAAELRRAIERYEAGRDSYVAKIEARYEQWLKPLRDEYSKAIEPVLDYIRSHHEEIFATTTQVDEVDASLKRTPSTQLVFDPKDEDNTSPIWSRPVTATWWTSPSRSRKNRSRSSRKSSRRPSVCGSLGLSTYC